MASIVRKIQDKEEHQTPFTDSGTSTPSYIWDYYDKVPTKKPGKFKLVCKVCHDINQHKEYVWISGNETETMVQHLDEVHGMANDSNSRTQLEACISEFSDGGSITPFVYNRQKMIDGMTTFVILKDLSFSFGESCSLEEYTKPLQPAYRMVHRSTLQRRIESQYRVARPALIAYFTGFEGRVALAIDTWSNSEQNDDHYLSISVHWIDSNYLLQKRIIAFDVIDEEYYTSYNTYSQICHTLDEFNLRDKIISISFDSATTKAKCIDHIKMNIPLLLDDVLLHVRCCAHIINLSVQEGISSIASLLTPIRNVIRWMRDNSSTIRRRYKTLCKEQELKPINFYLDIPTIWISTYKLLYQAIKYKGVVTILYNENHANSETFIDDNAWQIAQQVSVLLKAYYDATNVFSLVYEPNVNLVIIECAKIVMAMFDCEKTEPCLRPVIFEMKARWVSYFREFPCVYGIASLLDPGVKLDGLTNMLEFYYQTLGIEYDVKQYVDYCVSILNQLYDIYAKNSGLNVDSISRKSRRFDDVIASIIFRNSNNVPNTSSSSAIHEYLSFIHETDTSDFNILSWWHDHSLQFPILSRIARDVLVIPASTIVSESAFSAGRKFVSEKRSWLPSKYIKICACKKDWDQAKVRGQQENEFDVEDEDDPFLNTSSEED